MSIKAAWKRIKSPGGIQYIFANALSLSDEQAATHAVDMAKQIRAATMDHARDWLALVLRLPQDLREVLLDQLEHGNLMTGIGQSGWPTEHSIVANLRNRFDGKGRVFPAAVTWTVLNDPHQWLEGVSQSVDGQEFLLVA